MTRSWLAFWGILALCLTVSEAYAEESSDTELTPGYVLRTLAVSHRTALEACEALGGHIAGYGQAAPEDVDAMSAALNLLGNHGKIWAGTDTKQGLCPVWMSAYHYDSFQECGQKLPYLCRLGPGGYITAPTSPGGLPVGYVVVASGKTHREALDYCMSSRWTLAGFPAGTDDLALEAALEILNGVDAIWAGADTRAGMCPVRMSGSSTIEFQECQFSKPFVCRDPAILGYPATPAPADGPSPAYDPSPSYDVPPSYEASPEPSPAIYPEEPAPVAMPDDYNVISEAADHRTALLHCYDNTGVVAGYPAYEEDAAALDAAAEQLGGSQAMWAGSVTENGLCPVRVPGYDAVQWQDCQQTLPYVCMGLNSDVPMPIPSPYSQTQPSYPDAVPSPTPASPVASPSASPYPTTASPSMQSDYVLVFYGATHRGALLDCQEQGGFLAGPEDGADLDTAAHMLGEDQPLWAGAATQEGQCPIRSPNYSEIQWGDCEQSMAYVCRIIYGPAPNGVMPSGYTLAPGLLTHRNALEYCSNEGMTLAGYPSIDDEEGILAAMGALDSQAALWGGAGTAEGACPVRVPGQVDLKWQDCQQSLRFVCRSG